MHPLGDRDDETVRCAVLAPQHGWAISERIRQVSTDVLQVPQGSLYPALHRLERRGWIRAQWGTSDNNRRAKYYALTRAIRANSDFHIGDQALKQGRYRANRERMTVFGKRCPTRVTAADPPPAIDADARSTT